MSVADPLKGVASANAPRCARVLFCLDFRSSELGSSPNKKCRPYGWHSLAEEEGFEPPVPFGTPVFKTGAINRSATPPAAVKRGQR